MNNLTGTGVALVTPFDPKGSIDFEGLKKLLVFTGEHVDYFVVMGTTGESATCSPSEKKEVLDFCKKNNEKGLPIVYGIGGNNTAAVINEIKNTDLDGVDAILSASPYYNKPSQAGIVAHFTAIADVSTKPIILYNVPGRTASNMSADATLALSKHPNIIGIKEASGNIEQCKTIAAKKEDDFLLISGEDPLTTDIIEIGGKGVISVLANGFPEEFSNVINLALAGNFEESRKEMASFNEINPLMYEESNPVGVKTVLSLKGVCGNHVRLPLLKASSELQSRISELL